MLERLERLAFERYYPVTVLLVAVAYGAACYFVHPWLHRVLSAI